jgi:hypothetical protein
MDPVAVIDEPVECVSVDVDVREMAADRLPVEDIVWVLDPVPVEIILLDPVEFALRETVFVGLSDRDPKLERVAVPVGVAKILLDPDGTAERERVSVLVGLSGALDRVSVGVGLVTARERVVVRLRVLTGLTLGIPTCPATGLNMSNIDKNDTNLICIYL